MKKHTPYWTGVINRAITRKNKGLWGFTLKHIRLAGKWPSCACGKQDPRIPRTTLGSHSTIGQPIDTLMQDYGMEFLGAVGEDDPWNARFWLHEIEIREGEILEGLK